MSTWKTSVEINEFQTFIDDGDLIQVTSGATEEPVIGMMYNETANFIFLAIYREETLRSSIKDYDFRNRYFGPISRKTPKVIVIPKQSIVSIICSSNHILLEDDDVTS